MMDVQQMDSMQELERMGQKFNAIHKILYTCIGISNHILLIN